MLDCLDLRQSCGGSSPESKSGPADILTWPSGASLSHTPSSQTILLWAILGVILHGSNVASERDHSFLLDRMERTVCVEKGTSLLGCVPCWNVSLHYKG